MELMSSPSRFRCLLSVRVSSSGALARSRKKRLRMLSVLATLLSEPGITLAQPPVSPPNPVRIPSLPGPIQFKTSLVWQAVAGSTFETTHPYGHNLTTWKEVYLPAGATKLRLVTIGTFELENNYDFFEVWAFQKLGVGHAQALHRHNRPVADRGVRRPVLLPQAGDRSVNVEVRL